MWTMNLQMFKLDLEKAEEPRSNCQHPLDHRKSKRVPEKHLFLFIDYAKAVKFLKEVEYQTTWPASWETYMQVRKQQLELDMEKQTGFK